MLVKETAAASSIFIVLVFSVHVRSEEPPPADPQAPDTFSQTALLRRFDENRDGRLNTLERRALYEAMGRVDVPMLPAKPHRYALAIAQRHVSESNLLGTDNTPEDNPLTDAGAALGRVLFYDRQLSKNNSTSCASCHLQRRAFSDPQRFSVGFESGRTARNAMGLVNLRFTMLRGNNPGFFWDERAATLEELALLPIQDKIEMGMDLSELERKLQKLPYYPLLFKAAFGAPEVTSGRIAEAVAQFMRSLVSFDSKFDRAAQAADSDDYSQDFDAFTKEENLGKSLFIDGVGGVAEIGCAHCHIPPTFGMPMSFNNGLDLDYLDQGLGSRDVPSNDPFTPTNDGKFKAPSLRNIALTAPYMHDGRFKTLKRVVEHYSSGVQPHTNLGLALNEEEPAGDKGASGFQLTAAQKSALVAFLKTLTDEAFICDPRFSDPFVRLTD